MPIATNFAAIVAHELGHLNADFRPEESAIRESMENLLSTLKPKPKPKLKPKVIYSVIAIQDWLRVRGNASCSGYDAFDKKIEDEILERLGRNDIWAWASVEVKAECEGFTGSAYLGRCSYKDEKDFIKNSGYMPQLKKEALKALKDGLECKIKTAVQASDLLKRLG